MNSMIDQMQIKKLHLFCDIRVHEQLKRMTSIQNEIDGFQNCCEEMMKATLQSSITEETTLEELRGDQFLQTTMKLQSELIGRALLEVQKTIHLTKQIDESDNTGFHSHVTTLREQLAEEIHSRVYQ